MRLVRTSHIISQHALNSATITILILIHTVAYDLRLNSLRISDGGLIKAHGIMIKSVPYHIYHMIRFLLAIEAHH